MRIIKICGKFWRYLKQGILGVQQYRSAAPKIRPKANDREYPEKQPRHGERAAVVVDGASLETHGSSRAVSDNHSPFCTQVIRAGHRITGQRTVGERSHVPGHRVIRRVRGNTIMSPEVSQSGRNTNAHAILFASNIQNVSAIRNYKRPKTSAVSQKRAMSRSPIIWNLVNVAHFEIIEVRNCIIGHYLSQ